MAVKYSLDSSAKFINNYYEQQAGGNIPVFRGSTVQTGSGIGGIFSRLMKGVVPMLKEGAKIAGKELINSGVNIANDMINGKSFADSTKVNLKSGGKQLLRNLKNAYNSPKRGVTKRKQIKKKYIKTKRRTLNKDIFS